MLDLVYMALAYLAGFLSGILPKIFVDEWRRWRDKKERAKDRQTNFYREIKNWLARYQIRWNGFKNMEEKDEEAFKNELNWHADQITKIVSESTGSIEEDIGSETEGFANEIWKLGQTRFYMNGGKSLREFIQRGDELYRKAEEIVKKIKL